MLVLILGSRDSEFIVGSYCHWRMFLYRVRTSYQRLINLWDLWPRCSSLQCHPNNEILCSWHADMWIVALLFKLSSYRWFWHLWHSKPCLQSLKIWSLCAAEVQWQCTYSHFSPIQGMHSAVYHLFLRISLQDTTSLKLCGNNRRTSVTMRHHLTESFGCLWMPLPLIWRAFPHFLSSMSFWTKQCHERTNDFPVKLQVRLSLHSQWYQARRGRAANYVIGAWAQQSLHYVIFSWSTSFRCRWDPGKHVGVGAIGW